MEFREILITGGAGFVGSNLAIMLKQSDPTVAVTALDDLSRRGSELTLPHLQRAGVRFIHGDVRNLDDFDSVEPPDVIIDCAAEPSVHAGARKSPIHLIRTNLMGTVHCLEFARRHAAAVLFLSTSRVYPIDPIEALPFEETESRYVWSLNHHLPGISRMGISEDFSLEGRRSIYGATKLSSELLLHEFTHSYGIPALVNRCGVLAGPWQMGKVDQGFVSLWVARHYFNRPLRYIGYGGTGKQVRDVLHVRDLYELVRKQLEQPRKWDGRIYNVGGGPENSVSLRELTELCEASTGNKVSIEAEEATSPLDVRIFLTDSRRVSSDFGWKAVRSPGAIVDDIVRWISDNEADLMPIFGG